MTKFSGKKRNYPTDAPVLVTCGLPYASGPMHIGHLRTYVPADVFVRLLRKMRVDVTFVCGSDTHGTPIVTAAEKADVSPKELYEKYHQHYVDIFPKLNIQFDNYGTTDDVENHERTKQIVCVLQDEGYIYPKDLDSPFCDSCGRSLPDRYVRGECPYCHADARGDECDQGCGRYLEPGELLNPRCAICGSPTRSVTRKHYYFKLSAFEDFLKTYLTEVDGTKNARNYALGWVKEGLKDWCITRDLDWGVKYPGDEDLTLYVWVDAPIHYMSSTEQWAKKKSDPTAWEKFWKPGDGRLVHYIGQDIVYHHCIFWPAMLKGSNYNLPYAIVASGMVKIEGHNFSRSRGYVVWILDDYLDQGLHPDYLRYYMVSYTSQTKDLDFSWDAFRDKVNNELVGTFGNFIYRALHFSKKNFGQIPEGEPDAEIRKKIKQAIDSVIDGVNEYELKKVTDTILSLATLGNEYFQENKPWELVRSDKEKCAHVLFNAVYLVKALTILIDPIMPGVAEVIWKQLGSDTDIHSIPLSDAIEPPIAGTEIPKPKPVIHKLEDEVLAELNESIETRIRSAEAAEKGESIDMPTVSFEDFKKLDIRAGKILSCERVPKTDKLLKLEVDIGTETRQIVTGLAELYTPEELTGVTALFLVNLEPKKLAGVQSQGMIIAVEKADEKGKWLPVTIEGVPPGSKAA
ncbi:MAG: methionine--tRNA ligase [Candidatus Lokiarchaeota archaeon]|nr:methionine--tRNA ligase [Candidatus Lokiarchaeota archaeon]